MEQSDLLRHVCMAFEKLAIPYFVTGSQATIVYGEPRFTNDIDVVVSLRADQLAGFVREFPLEDYYWSESAARDAIAHRSMFNIIHPTSGLKVDVVVSGDTSFERQRFDRARKIQVAPDFTAMFSSPEDVILKKMEFFKIGGSDRHLRDIAGVLKISGEKIDREYIRRSADERGVADIWQSLLRSLESADR